MNSPSQAPLRIQDISALISKYWFLMITGTLLSTVLFTVAAYHLPKKYKSHFVLTIYSKYFQSPLIGDFVPGLSESGDPRSQRESLIRQVLTSEYLDALGQKYGIYASKTTAVIPPADQYQVLRSRLKTWLVELGLYQPSGSDSLHSEEREDLIKRIEIYSENSTTFYVGFVYSDPQVTYQVTQDIYAQVIKSLLDLRKRTLLNVHDAIRRRLGSLQFDLAASSPTQRAPSGVRIIEDQLADVRSEIRDMTAQYTDEHPLVIQLREKERLLVSKLANASVGRTDLASDQDKASAPRGSGETVRDVYGDLSKKMNYINIAIDSDQEHPEDYFATLESPFYPVVPLWPKTGLFVMWGVGFGLFSSLFIAALREYFERSALQADALAHQIGIPLLGELPPLPH